VDDREAPPAQPTLAEVFRRYASYVAAIGLRLLGRPDEVDDLVQDVFLRAHRGLERLREPGALKGWLATVTVRVAQRRLRSRRLRAFLPLAPDHDYSNLPQSGLSPEELTAASEIYALLDKLPTAERLAWSLRHIEGEKLETVADLTGTSLATVKRRIAAASRKLGEHRNG
jgi:RNA polymerase sigma-70 factor (ECF subfamily)